LGDKNSILRYTWGKSWGQACVIAIIVGVSGFALAGGVNANNTSLTPWASLVEAGAVMIRGYL